MTPQLFSPLPQGRESPTGATAWSLRCPGKLRAGSVPWSRRVLPHQAPGPWGAEAASSVSGADTPPETLRVTEKEQSVEEDSRRDPPAVRADSVSAHPQGSRGGAPTSE